MSETPAEPFSHDDRARAPHPPLSAREKLAVAVRGGLLLALMVYVAYSIAGGHQGMLTVGQAAPDAHLTSYDGVHWTLDKFAGRPMVVNFWGTWCPPCRAELPDLVKVAKQHADDVVFVGMVVDSPPNEVFAAVETFGIPYPVAAVDAVTVNAWQATSVPSTYILDAEHRVVWSARGQISDDMLERALASSLGAGAE